MAGFVFSSLRRFDPVASSVPRPDPRDHGMFIGVRLLCWECFGYNFNREEPQQVRDESQKVYKWPAVLKAQLEGLDIVPAVG